MIETEHERMQATTAFAVQEGERWRAQKHAEFATLSAGTVVVINVVSGEYVTAPGRLEAIDKFHQRFGHNTTLSYSFEVDRPVFIGGGIA